MYECLLLYSTYLPFKQYLLKLNKKHRKPNLYIMLDLINAFHLEIHEFTTTLEKKKSSA